MGFLFVMAIYVYIAYIAFSFLMFRKYYSDVLLLESTEKLEKEKSIKKDHDAEFYLEISI